MKIMRLSFRGFYFLLIYVVVAGGCKKEVQVGERDQDTFLEVLSRDSSHAVMAVTELDDQSLLLLENLYDGAECDFARLNQRGRLQERVTMVVPGTGSGQWRATKLKSGDIVYTQVLVDYVQRYKQDGTLLFSMRLMTTADDYFFFEPVEALNGDVLLPVVYVSFGGYEGSIIRVDGTGNILARHKVDMGSDLRSLETLEIAAQRGDTLLLVASTKPFFMDNVKAKVTAMTYQISTEKVLFQSIYDEQDNSESDFVIGAHPTAAGGVCLSSGNRNYFLPSINPSPEFELFFLDHQGKLIKRRRYGLGGYNCVPTKIIKTQDQGFLISGHINSTRPDHFFGFMLKVDAQGEIEASRIFSETQMVLFDCTESQDGHFLFGGAALSFGSGKDYVDGIVFKTNRDGKFD